MKIDTKIRFEEKYLPTKRHRIPRTRQVEETLTVELREVKKAEAPVALVVTNYQSYLDENGKDQFGLKETPFVAIDKKLYAEKRDMSGALDRGPFPMEDFLKDLSRYGDCNRCWDGKSREDVLRSLNEYVDSHVLIDGVIYKQRGEPRYKVLTFGLGHNHGGTSMFIDEWYNTNVGHQNYFNALQREEALAYADKVARARGDTDSIGTFADINIKVYMPEMIRCNPALDHGDGNPLLNMFHEITMTSDSSLEAGILAMAATGAEILQDEGKKPSLDDRISSAETKSKEGQGRTSASKTKESDMEI